MQATEKEVGRAYKLKQYRRHMAGLKSAIEAINNLTIDEAGDENIAAYFDRKDRFEQAATIIRRDLRIRTPKNLTYYKS